MSPAGDYEETFLKDSASMSFPTLRLRGIFDELDILRSADTILGGTSPESGFSQDSPEGLHASFNHQKEGSIDASKAAKAFEILKVLKYYLV